MLGRWVAFVAATAIWAGWPGAALAQPVFFDDFDGPDLLPHWQQPDPSHWEYDLSGGMLNVTGLFHPGIPHLGGNFAAIGTLFEPLADFRVDAWMGWDAGDDPHSIALQVRGPGGGSIIANFGYFDEEPMRDPVLSAGGVRVTAPPLASTSSRLRESAPGSITIWTGSSLRANRTDSARPRAEWSSISWARIRRGSWGPFKSTASELFQRRDASWLSALLPSRAPAAGGRDLWAPSPWRLVVLKKELEPQTRPAPPTHLAATARRPAAPADSRQP